MAGPLLYRGAPRWQVWAAFGGAFAIHAIAVGIAALRPVEEPVDLSAIPEAVIELTMEQAQPEATPPPEEEEPEPLDAPPEPTDPPEFQEEKPTPPPKPRTSPPKPTAPIARPQAAAGAPTGPAPSGRAAMISKGNVTYPYEARRAKLVGSGVAIVTVSPTGSVTSVSMGKSTGHPALDNAAIVGFRSARFKPGTAPTVKIPITFTLTGAQY